jgi:hypothetical protein
MAEIHVLFFLNVMKTRVESEAEAGAMLEMGSSLRLTLVVN